MPPDAYGIKPAFEKNTAAAAASDFIIPGNISTSAIEAYVQAALKADPVRVDVRHVDQYNKLDPALITLPVLVIAGVADPLAPQSSQTKLFLRLGSSHKFLVTVPNGDHAAFLEQPRAFFIHTLDSFFCWN